MPEEQTLPQLVEEIRGEQRRCWQAGERIRAETFLERYPALQADRDGALEVVYGEVMLREELGEDPQLDEYVQRFPQLAAQLGPLFEVHRALESGQLLDDNPPLSQIPDTLPAAPRRVAGKGTIFPTIPGYEILGELGRGGMGIVYRARQAGLNRIGAIKMILAGDYARPEELARFRTEAEAIGRLQHPNIVAIYEVGEQNGRPYLCMEYVDGGSLAQQLTGAPQPTRPAAQLVETLARAMHYAHQQGIVHRDLKPANVLLQIADCRLQIQRQGDGADSQSAIWNLQSAIPKITDFGLAKILAEGSGSQTKTGAILGTPSYMAPEQASSDDRGSRMEDREATGSLSSILDPPSSKLRRVGPAADIYALGAILYELLTGRPPFRAETPLETLLQVTTLEPVPPSRLQPHLPHDLATICMKCLQKEPAKRYGSALELADDLKRFLDGKPILARPVGTTERLWRWSCRNPILATMTVSVASLVLVIALGASIAAVGFNDERNVATGNWLRAEQAEQTAMQSAQDATDKLWQSLLAQAEAGRRSDQAGRRHKSLKALAEAAAIRPDLKLRNEAIASMALVDLHVIQQWRDRGHPYLGVAFDPSLQHYARNDGKGNYLIRRISDGQEIRRFPDPFPCWFTYLMFSPDGRYLAIGYYGGRGADHCIVWDVQQGEKIRESPLIPVVVHGGGFAFSADSRRLAVGLPEGQIAVYDLPQHKELLRTDQDWKPEKIAFHPDGGRLAFTSRQPEVRVLDVAAGKIVASFDVPSHTSGIAWSPDGQRLAAGCDNTHIYVWDMFNPSPNPLPGSGRGQGERSGGVSPVGRLHAVLEGHQSLPIYLTFNHAGNLLASHSWDNTTRLWDPVSGRSLVSAPGFGISFSPDDQRLAFGDSGPEGLQLGVWEVADGKECRTLHHGAIGNRSPWTGYMSITGVDFSRHSRLLASAGPGGVQLWDAASGANVGHLADQASSTARFQADESHLLTYGNKGLELWPISEPERGRRGEGETREGYLVSASPPRPIPRSPHRAVLVGPAQSLDVTGPGVPHDRCCCSNGGAIAAVDRDWRIVLMNVDKPAEKVLFRPYQGMMSIAISPDERWIATGVWTGPTLIWDTKSPNEPVRQLPANRAFVAFSPNGKWLVTGDWGDFRFWKVGSWQAGPVIHREHMTEGLGPLAFSKDGRILAVAHSAQNVRLIDIDSGKEIATLSAPDPQVIWDLSFNQDGSLLAAATANHVIQLWDLREIRRQLATMGLDWDLLSYPPPSNKATEPIHVTVITPDSKEELHRELDKLNLALQQNPDDAGYYRQRAAIYDRLGDLQKAVADYDEAIQRKSKSSASPRMADLYLKRARLQSRLGYFAQAIDDLNEAVLRHPSADAFFSRGWNYERIQEYPKAVADLRKALEMDPNCAQALNELAWIYVTGPAEARAPEKALPLAQKAVHLSPNSGNSRNTLGVVHYRLGQFEAAVDELQRAIQDNKGEATADDLFFLAMAYHHLGDAAKARDYYDQALRWWQAHGELTPFRITELTNFRAEADALLGIRGPP
jgi:serine/threonine protein kinase/WD40 repeat protein/Flp pilus assembly protein TadD